MICTHESLMRVMRNSSELRQYHLEQEKQAMLNDTSFRDTLQVFVENGQNINSPITESSDIGTTSNFSSSTNGRSAVKMQA